MPASEVNVAVACGARTYALTVTGIVGSGSVNCVEGCTSGTSYTHDPAAQIVLTAVAAGGLACSRPGVATAPALGRTRPARSPATGPHAVSATFIQQFGLSVTVTGSGSVECSVGGGVVGLPGPFNAGTVVNVLASPAPGAFFFGWQGECAYVTDGGFICQVQMLAPRSVTAPFSCRAVGGDHGGGAAIRHRRVRPLFTANQAIPL